MSVVSSIPLENADATASSDLKKVVIGSSLGTAFEWYDFFVYGTLASVLGPLFFSKELGETGAFLASLATYGAGLVLRPFGSVLFGRLGDLVGRKHTFLITIILMGISTAGVGFLPTYENRGRDGHRIACVSALSAGLGAGRRIRWSSHLRRRARWTRATWLCDWMDPDLRNDGFLFVAHCCSYDAADDGYGLQDVRLAYSIRDLDLAARSVGLYPPTP
jgi:hypothetical protein